jgi:hypothetical protein
MSFTPNPEGIEAMFAEVAAKMEAVDRQLRAEFTGRPWQEIEEPAARAFAAIGVNLTGDISDYAKSIEKNQDFTFNLE